MERRGLFTHVDIQKNKRKKLQLLKMRRNNVNNIYQMKSIIINNTP